MHPALGSVDVADLAPLIVLGDDLDRQGGAPEDPFHRILLARPGAQVDLVGAQRGEARQADVLGGVDGTVREQQHEPEEQGGAESEGHRPTHDETGNASIILPARASSLDATG